MRLTTYARMYSLLWQCFDRARTKETGGDYNLILDNSVSVSVPASSNDRILVEEIARQSQRPIPIASLPEVLSQRDFIRGKVVFGSMGNAIDKVAINYEGMRRWISKEGLNMAIVPPASAKLSRFDEFAGRHYVDKSKDGKISKEILVVIAKELDAAGFLLKEQLQPAQWRAIAGHNQRNARQPIKTFTQACLHRVSGRAVRRRMYVAREKYVKAYTPVSWLPGMSSV